MKAAVVKASLLAQLGTWSARTILADSEGEELAKAEAALKRAKARLRLAKRRKSEADALLADRVAAGDITIIR